MVDSTPFQPMFSPGDFRAFPPAVATEGAALPYGGRVARADECSDAPPDAQPA